MEIETWVLPLLVIGIFIILRVISIIEVRQIPPDLQVTKSATATASASALPIGERRASSC